GEALRKHADLADRGHIERVERSLARVIYDDRGVDENHDGEQRREQRQLAAGKGLTQAANLADGAPGSARLDCRSACHERKLQKFESVSHGYPLAQELAVAPDDRQVDESRAGVALR